MADDDDENSRYFMKALLIKKIFASRTRRMNMMSYLKILM